MDFKEIPEARWYEKSTGYIGYDSKVFPGLVCRVYEACLDMNDIMSNTKDSWQYAVPDADNFQHTEVLAHESELHAEAIGVTNKRRAAVLGLVAMERESGVPGDGMKAMDVQTNRIRLWRSFGMTDRTFRRKTRIK